MSLVILMMAIGMKGHPVLCLLGTTFSTGDAMMQVQRFLRLEQQVALFASVVLRLEHLKLASRMGSLLHRSFRPFGPVGPERRIIRTVASADFDVRLWKIQAIRVV